MSEAKHPLQVHELLGDAVTMYAPVGSAESNPEWIYTQMQKMHDAFNGTESDHISECSLCACEACNNIDKLKLKIIAHVGEAAFTKVGGLQKISGENVILTHRWLKNSIPSREYFLLTEQFANTLDDNARTGLLRHNETLEGLGAKTAFYRDLNSEPPPPAKPTFYSKIKKNTELNLHCIVRMLGKRKKEFRNLPD